MKKYLFVLLMAVVFIGCNYEFKQKEEVEKVKIVHISDIGRFEVKGDVDFQGNGIIEFTDSRGLEFVTHISLCIIVTSPKPQPQVQLPKPVPPENPPRKPVTKPKVEESKK